MFVQKDAKNNLGKRFSFNTVALEVHIKLSCKFFSECDKNISVSIYRKVNG